MSVWEIKGKGGLSNYRKMLYNHSYIDHVHPSVAGYAPFIKTYQCYILKLKTIYWNYQMNQSHMRL